MEHYEHIISFDVTQDFLKQFPPLVCERKEIPWSLWQLIAIAKELMDITRDKPFRSLHMIAYELRQLVPQLKAELDPLWLRTKKSA